jgi:hypothetical protein
MNSEEYESTSYNLSAGGVRAFLGTDQPDGNKKPVGLARLRASTEISD